MRNACHIVEDPFSSFVLCVTRALVAFGLTSADVTVSASQHTVLVECLEPGLARALRAGLEPHLDVITDGDRGLRLAPFGTLFLEVEQEI